MPKAEPARLPPQNLDAEEYVLGAMLLSPAAVESAADLVSAPDFYRPSHGRIFQAILDLYNDDLPADPITVADRLEAAGALTEAGGKERVHELAALVPATSNVAHHARIVREMATLRGFVAVGDQIQRMGWERPKDTAEMLEEVEGLMFGLARQRHRADFTIAATLARETYDRMQDLAARGLEIVGLPTGFPTLDRMTSGLRPGNLIVLAGRPSMGKTALALNMAANITVRQEPPVPVAFFTLEMSREEVMQRIYSSDSLVASERIQTPSRLDREEWSRVAQTAQRFSAAPLFVDDSGAVTLNEIRSKVRRLKLRQPDLGLVIIDYLQLMVSGSGRDENRNLELSAISRGLKRLAGELGLPVLLLSQLSREVERRHDKRPQLSDLRDSGAIEQDADLVIFVYREEYYFPEEEELQGVAEVIFAKHRNGPVGMRRLSFVSRFARFTELQPSPSGQG